MSTRMSWECFNCMASEALQTHWLTGTGCLHYADGGGDNAASCWCGWNGPRVPNVGEAVRTWAEHAAEELAIAARAASGIEAPSGGETGTGSTVGEGPTGEAGDAQ